MISNGREWPSNLNIVLRVAGSFYATYFKSEINHIWIGELLNTLDYLRKTMIAILHMKIFQCMSSDFYDFGIIRNPKQLKILKY